MVLYLLKILQIKGSSYNFIRVENETVNVNKLYNEKKNKQKRFELHFFTKSRCTLYTPCEDQVCKKPTDC